MSTATMPVEAEITIQEMRFIADSLGLANLHELDRSRLNSYKRGILSYYRTIREQSRLFKANDLLREKLQFFASNYATNWLPTE